MNATTAGSVVRASAWRRIQAFALDYVLILSYLLALMLVGVIVTMGPLADRWTDLFSNPWRADALAFLLTVLPVLLYFALAESSSSAATWGKRRVGIRVVGPAGAAASLPRALVRTAVKLLPWQMAHSAMFHIPGFPTASEDPPFGSVVLLTLVWILVAVYLVGITKLAGNRTVYDRIAGTIVLERSSASGSDLET